MIVEVNLMNQIHYRNNINIKQQRHSDNRNLSVQTLQLNFFYNFYQSENFPTF